MLVGVRQEYKGAQGRISVYFGNASRAPLTNFRVILEQVDHLRIQIEATEGLLDDGCNIAPGTQAKLLLLLQVMAPFSDVPSIRIMFHTNNGINHHEHHLRLPVIAICFMEPIVLEMQNFKNQWHVLEQQECRDILKHVPANHAYMNHIADLIKGLNFGRCLACDDTQWSVTGAAVLHTAAKDLNGNNVNVLCLVRIEADHQHRALRYVCIYDLSLLCPSSFYAHYHIFMQCVIECQRGHSNFYAPKRCTAFCWRPSKINSLLDHVYELGVITGMFKFVFGFALLECGMCAVRADEH